MLRHGLPYAAYERCAAAANIVVDGSPTPATRLLLTHWPGFAAPDGLARDTSAAMALAYLRDPRELHGDATCVSNNHFDQDGLAGLLALTDPAFAADHGDELVHVAEAGDFGVARTRVAARISMAIAALADPDRTPLRGPAADPDAPGQMPALFDAALDLLPRWLEEPDSARELWADEDAALDASEAAFDAGAVDIVEDHDLDLAVVTVDPVVGPWSGHRFCGRSFDGLHPMALHDRTDRTTIALVAGAGAGAAVTVTCRYEGWVQFCSRPVWARRDLRPLADLLSADERAGAPWSATGPGDLTPTLTCDGESSLPPSVVVDHLRRHLATAPRAWDPYATGG